MLLVSRLRVTVTPAAARCTVYKPHINDTGGMYTHTTPTLQKTRIQDLLYTVVTVHSSQNMLEGWDTLHHHSRGTYLLIQL